VIVFYQNLATGHPVQLVETSRREVLLTEVAPLLLFGGRRLMLRKKLCRERLADDPIPWKTFAQRWVLSPGRVPQGIALGGISQPEGEVYSKMVMQVLTHVLRAVHDGDVVLRELSSWTNPREHPVRQVS